MRKVWRYPVLVTIALIATVLLIVFAVRVAGPSIYFAYKINSLSSAKERLLLHKINHAVLAAQLRDFAEKERWGRDGKFAEMNVYNVTDPKLPLELRALDPSRILVFDDRIELEFGGALHSFGLRVFRPGIVGSGTKQLGDGIWFYSDE